MSWKDRAFLHFALYLSKGVVTRGLQVGFPVDDLDAMHAKLIAAGVPAKTAKVMSMAVSTPAVAPSFPPTDGRRDMRFRRCGMR